MSTSATTTKAWWELPTVITAGASAASPLRRCSPPPVSATFFKFSLTIPVYNFTDY
ncbi:hypothetical protein ACS0TY_014502 [Phlomoides rotata]